MEKNKQKNRYILLKIIAAAAVLFIILAIFSFPLKTVYYNVYTDEVTGNVRIAQISDLHSCSYGKDMKNLINALDKTAPDVVVLTGDIYDDVVDNTNTRTFLKAIAVKYPCYYIAGNHENLKGDWAEYKAEAESFGITVLEGENVSFGEVMICGAASSSEGKFDHEDSVKMCAENAQGFAVLLAHFPEDIDYYRSFGCFDLVLSGHAHGGQWRIPYLINGVFAPGQGLFPEYAGGRYDFDDCTFIVSRGLSRTKNVIPRIFNNPELVVIDITASE